MTFIDPSVKLFQHIDRLSLIKNGLNVPPVNVEIDLSNRCSLGCEWCHFAYTHTRGPLSGKRLKPLNAVPGGDLMNTDLALSIIDQLADFGVQSITWTGGGEPTLHPDFDKIILHGSKRLKQGIYTHGGHIDGWRAELLKKTHEFVYVSLDAIDGATYKRDKGVDRFHAVCANVRRLVAAPGGATIGIGFLVTEKNWKSVFEAHALTLDLGADYVQYRPTISYSQTNPGVPDEDTSWLDEAIPVLSQLNGHQAVEIDVDRFEQYRNWESHGYKTCYWSMLQTVITPNGKVWTCVNKREHPGEEIGDLSGETFASVWGRHKVCEVNENCRVMCRGHVANQTLDRIFAPMPHSEFI